jgi:hypothetical protein
MKVLDWRTLPGAKWVTLPVGIASLAAVLTAGAVAVHSIRQRPASIGTESGVEAVALKWFTEMQAGQIDRSQLTADYSAQLTDAAVQGMSRYLGEFRYGISPTRAEVLQSRTSGQQKLYVVELLFPRGDAASLLFGLNVKNQITGVSLLSMAGD